MQLDPNQTVIQRALSRAMKRVQGQMPAHEQRLADAKATLKAAQAADASAVVQREAIREALAKARADLASSKADLDALMAGIYLGELQASPSKENALIRAVQRAEAGVKVLEQRADRATYVEALAMQDVNAATRNLEAASSLHYAAELQATGGADVLTARDFAEEASQ